MSKNVTTSLLISTKQNMPFNVLQHSVWMKRLIFSLLPPAVKQIVSSGFCAAAYRSGDVTVQSHDICVYPMLRRPLHCY